MSLKTFFKIGEANAEVARLTGELTNIQTNLTTLTTERDTARNELATVRTELSTAQTNLTAVTGERDSARVELATAKAKILELEGKQTTVEARAAEVAATVGTPNPLNAEDKKAETKSKDQLWAEYHALTDSTARREFWNKNKAALTGKGK